MKFDEEALELILRTEDAKLYQGFAQPPKWPGNKNSGITIGFGDDLGHTTAAGFLRRWQDVLPPVSISKLRAVVGLRGQACVPFLPDLRQIKITKEQALTVFNERSLPNWIDTTRNFCPGFDALPLKAQGALVSLVYNRGTSTVGPKRAEMKNIQLLVAQFSASRANKSLVLQHIANEILKMNETMKDDWASVPGLFSRRKNEAALVVKSIQDVKVDHPVHVDNYSLCER